ncbi:BQ00720 family protein [Methylobacterium sp. A54F]
MTELNTSPLTPADLDPADFNPADLAALGEGHLAYVRPIRSDDVKRLFPQAPDLSPGLDLFALLSASGAPILLADSRDVIVANAMAHDLHTVSLH